MAKKKITGQDRKEYTVKEKKPFYKKIWFWLLVVVALFVVVGVAGSGSDDEADTSTKTEKSTKGHTTTDKEKGTESAKSSSKTVTIDMEDYKVADQKTFNTDYSDSAWAGTKVTVDKVEIDTLKNPIEYDSANDGKFDIQGVMRIHTSVTPQRDINFYPTQGKIIAGSEQEEATSDESWDGEISNGATKDGWATFPLKSTKDISNVRFQFDADYDTDDMDDENFSKTYDITLNLQ